MAEQLLKIRQLARNLPLFKGVKKFKIATPRKQQIWIKNTGELISKISKIKSEGISSLDIVTDYDYTLTKFRDEGKHCQSLFGILGSTNHLPDEFKNKLISNYLKYGPYETDPTIAFSQKVLLLDEFYKIQKKLLVEHRPNQDMIQQIMNESNIVFRYGAKYLFNRAAQLNLPIYVVSGGISDILYNSIYSIVRDKRLENVHTYANRLVWDENSHITGFEDLTIHSYNKFRVIPELVKERKNCILMGDLVTDYYMTLKCSYQTQICIFYAKENETEQRKSAMRKFDIIVESDESLRFVIFLINYLSGTIVDKDYVEQCHPTFAKELLVSDVTPTVIIHKTQDKCTIPPATLSTDPTVKPEDTLINANKIN